MIYNVEDFGAIPDGKTLNTKAVQNAINECSMRGGGQVVFSKGEYVLSTVYLKSGVEIKIGQEATLLGSLNFDDYDKDEKVDYPLYQDASHSFFHCSMFVGENCDNIKITGNGLIDMRSVWDEENKRNMAHRGAKCIALKNCQNVELSGFSLLNATDLAIYFAGTENVNISRLKLKVYIDGISPDNSKNVNISNCEVEAGDDAIVFKSSYTLNRLGICKDITVNNCKLKSRCYAVKFGTETNGGFKNICVENSEIRETRICGVGIESADGAIVDGITVKNIVMKNVNVPFFVHLSNRMRGPKGLTVGQIKNILFEDIKVSGPYEPYEIVPCYYDDYKAGNNFQNPKNFGIAAGLFATDSVDNWQMTSNVCGLKENRIENIVFKNIKLELDGGILSFNSEVPERECQDYPEVYNYGRILPAKGIYFRHIDGLTVENVKVVTNRKDVRENFIFDDVKNLKVVKGE